MIFHIIAPLSAISNRPRLYKLVAFIQMKYPAWIIRHTGWERKKGEAVELFLNNINKNFILKGGGEGGGKKVRLMYIVWIINTFFYCLRFDRNTLVWALGFESALPALMASKFKGFKVVFDDADRFSLLFSMPKPLRKFVGKLEKLTSRRVQKHLIPGLERYDFESDRFFLLRNTPSKNELLAAQRNFLYDSWPKNRIVLNVNGWLGEGRGIDATLMLAKRFNGKGLSIILAGPIGCSEADELRMMENVCYQGSISNSDALCSYFASDFVLTYYKPSTMINQLACSNKWGDAVKTRTGIIVNSEVKTADYLRDSGVAISVPYFDHESLAEIIQNLIDNPDEKFKYQKAALDLASETKYFEDQLSILFQMLAYGK